MKRAISFRYKSGYECTHAPHVDEGEWWEMIGNIIDEMNKEQSGLLITKSPFGIHRLTDVEAIHFGDVTPPSSSDIPTLGFVKE